MTTDIARRDAAALDAQTALRVSCGSSPTSRGAARERSPVRSRCGLRSTRARRRIESAEVVEGRLDDRRRRRANASATSGSGFRRSIRAGWPPCSATNRQLVYPDCGWSCGDLDPGRIPTLPPGRWSAPFEGGEDRYAEITPDDFFDGAVDVRRRRTGQRRPCADAVLRSVAPGRARSLFACAARAAGGRLGSGFAGRAELRTCCVDLPEPDKQARPQFDLERLRLDPTLPDERAEIIAAAAATGGLCRGGCARSSCCSMSRRV